MIIVTSKLVVKSDHGFLSTVTIDNRQSDVVGSSNYFFFKHKQTTAHTIENWYLNQFNDRTRFNEKQQKTEREKSSETEIKYRSHRMLNHNYLLNVFCYNRMAVELHATSAGT